MTRLSRLLTYMNYEKLYTRDHKWITLNRYAGTATIGITKPFQKKFGEIIYISTLPRVSQQINRNDLLATLEAVKSISDIHSPITGKLVALNMKTEIDPEIINQDAENEGWLFELKLDSLLELSELLDKSEYEKYLKETMFY